MKFRRASSVAIAALTCVLATLAAGCGSSDSSDGGKAKAGELPKVIAFGEPLVANPSLKAVGDDFEKAAEKLGIKVYRFDNNFNAVTELKNARLMVGRKPDLIVNWSPD